MDGISLVRLHLLDLVWRYVGDTYGILLKTMLDMELKVQRRRELQNLAFVNI